MNPQKSEVKIGLINKMGADFEDRKEAAEKNIMRFEGAENVLKAMPKKFDSIRASFHEKRDSEEITLEELQIALRAIDLCQNSLASVLATTEANRLQALGALDQLQKTVAYFQKLREEEIGRLQSLQRMLDNEDLSESQRIALAQGRPPLSVVAGSPAADIQRRRDEARKAKQAQAQVEPSAEDPPTITDEEEEASPDAIEEPEAPVEQPSSEVEKPPKLFG